MQKTRTQEPELPETAEQQLPTDSSQVEQQSEPEPPTESPMLTILQSAPKEVSQRSCIALLAIKDTAAATVPPEKSEAGRSCRRTQEVFAR